MRERGFCAPAVGRGKHRAELDGCLFRLLVALNDRLPSRARFVRNPTVTLR